eukprot:265789-Alexandrium_andersonii.AAC.1
MQHWRRPRPPSAGYGIRTDRARLRARAGCLTRISSASERGLWGWCLQHQTGLASEVRLATRKSLAKPRRPSSR